MTLNMRLVLLFLVTLAALVADGALSPPERSYKILMLLPVSAKSHRNVFMPLADGLIKRGHKVTMLSNHPLNHPKIEHFRHNVKRFDTDSMNMFEIERDSIKSYAFFQQEFLFIAKEMYDDPSVIDLYKRRKEFDLIVIDQMFNNVMYPFAFEHKFITVATAGLEPVHSAVMGNFLNPAYHSNVMDYISHPMSFVDRIKNIFFTIVRAKAFRGGLNYHTEPEMLKRFPHLPPLFDIEANQSLTLMNHHFTFDKVAPLLPSQVEVGGMHCGPAKPLPKDIADFLSGSTPVVYMSLGSIARSELMPKEYQEIIKTTFSKLPYKVLWKYEDESVKGLSKNIMVKKWMPQQDVLAHPNVKVFITHCGGLGTQEAMYHSTPMLGLPIFGDQNKNGKTLQDSGLGRIINWDDLSVPLLTEAIQDVVSNPEYLNKVKKVSAAFRDQLEDPVDRAVFWTEYVIRHDGAPHLRSPERDLTWVQLLHLDILLAVHVLVFLVYKFITIFFSLLCGSAKGKRKLKRN